MTAIIKQVIAQPYENEDKVAQLTALTFTPVVTGTNHTFEVGTRGVILQVNNTSATTAETIDIEASYDDFGRLAPIVAFSVVGGATVARKFLPKGWEVTAGSGIVSFTVSATGLEVALIEL